MSAPRPTPAWEPAADPCGRIVVGRHAESREHSLGTEAVPRAATSTRPSQREPDESVTHSVDPGPDRLFGAVAVPLAGLAPRISARTGGPPRSVRRRSAAGPPR